MNVLWFVGSLAFLAGILCGALIFQLLSSSKSRNGKLEGQLEELQGEFREYQDRVGDHFTTTAHLINKLTDTYKDVHEHMANGAEALCEDEETRNRLSDSLLSSNALLSGKISKRRNERTKPVEQPRDYAPKSSPDEKGSLAEDFGVKPETMQAPDSQTA
ncbi:hypothetical protein ACH42_07115 [Endozoicomonas sp. (ex Bugula neritina AB1)]|nr:hypothetical protein ACH42_07115 [Endozoicomonas sp. (ex Bugula neritina AB1)]